MRRLRVALAAVAAAVAGCEKYEKPPSPPWTWADVGMAAVVVVGLTAVLFFVYRLCRLHYLDEQDKRRARRGTADE
jgi:hypothetical protein